VGVGVALGDALGDALAGAGVRDAEGEGLACAAALGLAETLAAGSLAPGGGVRRLSHW
jgi:hypothetical protein